MTSDGVVIGRRVTGPGGVFMSCWINEFRRILVSA